MTLRREAHVELAAEVLILRAELSALRAREAEMRAEIERLRADMVKIARRPHGRERIVDALDFKVRCAEKALKRIAALSQPDSGEGT